MNEIRSLKQFFHDDIALLLTQCAHSDNAAFRRLYDQQASMLYRVALRITRDAGLASDAVHDAMLQVWRRAAWFDPALGNGRAWLVSLVRYRALDAMRRTRHEVRGAKVAERVDPEPLALERLQTSRNSQALHRCLQEVEPGRRRLVLLAFIEGLSHSEIAHRTHLPQGTVKSGIRRALRLMQARLQRNDLL